MFFSVMVISGMRHSDKNPWLFLPFQIAAAGITSQFTLSGYIWSRSLFRSHGAVFVRFSLSKFTRVVLALLWVVQASLAGLCFHDRLKYRLFADVSFSVSWLMTLLITTMIAIPIIRIYYALRPSRLLGPKSQMLGLVDFHLKLSWIVTVFAGVPSLVILPLFILEADLKNDFLWWRLGLETPWFISIIVVVVAFGFGFKETASPHAALPNSEYMSTTGSIIGPFSFPPLSSHALSGVASSA